MRNLAKDTNLENGIVAIKFFATWCGPCRLYGPVFERQAAQMPDANFYELDVDSEPEIAERFQITTVPTTVILKDGGEIGRVLGAKSTKLLDTAMSDVLHSSDDRT